MKSKQEAISSAMSTDYIIIEGAREHNLKNITVKIPRNSLTVITGLSGSGKSSLAFDTLYAEGQRKYVESLSAYARQFLDQMQKPDVDKIEGLSPAIAIEQRSGGGNPRSIVATSTEIHDYLRLLYSSLGQPHCPQCEKPVVRQSAEQIVEQILALPIRSMVVVLAPLIIGKKGKHKEIFERARKDGFVRCRVDGEIYELDDVPELDNKKKHTIELVVDRLIITEKIRARMTDSVELSLKHGNGVVVILYKSEKATEWQEILFSEKNACIKCGISFEQLTSRHFSFNSPYGACPACAGLGTRLEFDEDLIVPDKNVSLADGAIVPWRRGGRRLVIYYKQLLRSVASHYEFSLEIPFGSLLLQHRKILMYGSGDENIQFGYWRGGTYHKYWRPFEGVIPNLQRRLEATESDAVREWLHRFMTRHPCPECGGARLKPEVIACTIENKSIVDVTRMTVKQAFDFLSNLKLNQQEQKMAGEVLKELIRRLRFLVEVGLDYLTLDRETSSLSGGEAQRIRLATQIGSGLTGVLYVLDEPTIGLHRRDNVRLIRMLKELRNLGNTVVVVEHDDEMIRTADYVIDLGPGAGRHGGHLVVQGTLDELLKNETSLTARYLSNNSLRFIHRQRVKPSDKWLIIRGASENNLRNIDVHIPLGLFVCVTGVSGSGKSTLVDDILRRALFRKLYRAKERPGKHRSIEGIEHLDKVILVDQSPIGRTPRSNPATYTGAFDTIRRLFSEVPFAKVRGYGPGRFSFNVKGGRCETCKGDGVIRLEMHFLPDVYVTCEQCNGKRYNKETLEILYKGKNIAEVLAMTVDEALDFFQNIPAITRKVRALSEAGLGYLQLGQPATTLSGGEAQRVKLATELSKTSTGHTLYLFDEPTTGLHFADVQKLLQVLIKLRNAGNTVLVIEHNVDVIMASDYVIDLGPEGGENGGQIVATGTPEEIIKCKTSYTGNFLTKIIHGAE